MWDEIGKHPETYGTFLFLIHSEEKSYETLENELIRHFPTMFLCNRIDSNPTRHEEDDRQINRDFDQRSYVGHRLRTKAAQLKVIKFMTIGFWQIRKI